MAKITEETKVGSIVFNRSFKSMLVLFLKNLLIEHFKLQGDEISSNYDKTIQEVAKNKGLQDSDIQTFLQEANEAIQSGF